MRAEPFVPDQTCEGLCRGSETCSYLGPHTCSFLKTYRAQLDKLDFQEIMERFAAIGQKIQEAEGFKEEPVFVLLFHEKYDNLCSERWPVQAWFKDHGIEVEEFNFPVKIRGMRRHLDILEDQDFF